MKVDTKQEAFRIVFDKIGAYKLDEKSSENAGYNIYRSIYNYNDYACDLGDRVELNTNDNKTLNIWINNEPLEVRTLRLMVEKQEIEILRLKAKLYDLLCK